MRWRRARFGRPCKSAESCPRYDPDGTVGAATVEIRGVLSAFQRDMGAMLADDEYHRQHHAALNRITVLENTLAMVMRDLDAGGALTPATVTLVDQVLP